MRLAHLIAQYRLTEIRLRQAITLGSPAERAAELLRACAERMDRLEGFEPQTPSELRRLTFFFLRRAALISSAQPVNRELDVALELLNRYSGSWPVPFEAPNDDGTPMSDDGAPAREIPATMTHYVSNAFELITAVDFNFRVLAASEPFARHLGISRKWCRGRCRRCWTGPALPIAGRCWTAAFRAGCRNSSCARNAVTAPAGCAARCARSATNGAPCCAP
jgi:hypothetical protein